MITWLTLSKNVQLLLWAASSSGTNLTSKFRVLSSNDSSCFLSFAETFFPSSMIDKTRSGMRIVNVWGERTPDNYSKGASKLFRFKKLFSETRKNKFILQYNSSGTKIFLVESTTRARKQYLRTDDGSLHYSLHYIVPTCATHTVELVLRVRHICMFSGRQLFKSCY